MVGSTRGKWAVSVVSEWRAVIFGTALAGLVWLSGCGPSGDYLSPPLRERVERLKLEAQNPSTDPAVLGERLGTLWDWANAYSLTGGPVPGGFPQLAANANRGLRRLRGAGPVTPVEAVSAFVERYTREFQIKDEMPGAMGELRLSQTGPFRAGEHVTVSLVYEVGDLPMATGGGIVIGRSRSAAHQGTAPGAANYVTVKTSRSDAVFRVGEPWGRWITFETRGGLSYRLTGAQLEKGDTVTITFGDRSGGGPGLRLQNWSNDRVVFKTFLDLEGRGWLLSPAWPSLEVVGEEEVRFLNAIAPSIVEPGESFTLSVRAEDRHKNLSSGPMPAVDVLLNGEPFRAVSQGGPAMHHIEGVTLDTPGVYRFEVRSAAGAIAGTSNPVRVEEGPSRRIYWGELHGHTGFAEGQGSPDGYFRFGRDVARLDFLSLSEHDIWMDDFEWRTLQEMVEKYREPGKFTPILGFEWTSRLPWGGHHNVFFRNTEGRQRVPNQTAPLLDELYQGLRDGNEDEDVLVVPHAHQPGDWTNSDPGIERLVEIQSGHGTFDWFGNKYLENGYRVGFIGASDNHVGHPGYTGMTNRQMGGLAAVLAPENTGEAIFSALRRRATYATTGERIILDAEADGAGMGQTQVNSAARTIQCSVSGTAPIDSIEVVKNGKVIYTKRYLQGDLTENAAVQISFEASTEVVGRRQVPRGDRPWKGVVRVEGAEIVGLDEPWYAHPSTYSAALQGDRVEFRTNTRGRSLGLVLKLRGASADTRVVVEMEETLELNGSGGYERTRQTLPANRQDFILGDLGGGVDRREYQVLEHTDALSLQLVVDGGSLDQDFTYTDQDDLEEGDSYYLRVRQLDGAMAWSSPVWIGGDL